MIPCIVPHNDSGFSPVRVLVVEGLYQLCHEQLHSVTIRVRLQETCVELSFGIECNDQGDPRRDRLDGHSVTHTFELPASASIVIRVYPALVVIDESLPCLKQLKELD